MRGRAADRTIQRPMTPLQSWDSHPLDSELTLTFPANDTDWGLWIFHGSVTRVCHFWDGANNGFLDVIVPVSSGLLSTDVCVPPVLHSHISLPINSCSFNIQTLYPWDLFLIWNIFILIIISWSHFPSAVTSHCKLLLAVCCCFFSL